MFPCNHDKTSTDYVKAFGFLSLIVTNLMTDYNQPSKGMLESSSTFYKYSFLQIFCCYFMHRGIGAFLSDRRSYIPVIFRANHNRYQTDHMKTLGLILSLIGISNFVVQSAKCLTLLLIKPSKNPIKQIEALVNQIHALTAMVCLSSIAFRLVKKGVSACVSNDDRLSAFRIGID